MSASFGTVAVLGAGLLGSSLGLVLKGRGLADTVRGAGRREETLEKAKAMGAIDTAHLDMREACDGADLIVLCTPAAGIPNQLDAVQPACAAHAIVTDVASTKATICNHASATWPQPLRFVGSHPMAGSEKFGPEHARPDLYEGAWTIVCPQNAADDAHKTVTRLWESVGARVIELSPDDHDAIVARTSHVPHVVAACLAEVAASSGDVSSLVGKGFRDATRIVEGRPELWRDICLTNREAVLNGLDAFAQRLEAVRGFIDNADGAELDAFFEAAREARQRLAKE